MKLTIARLKKLIKEELETVMQEEDLNEVLDLDSIYKRINKMHELGYIDEKERRIRIKQAQNSNADELKAMDAEMRKAALAKNPNYNVGLHGPSQNQAEFGYISPNITSFNLSDEQAEKRKVILNMFHDLSKKMGGNEALYKKLVDVSGGKYTSTQQPRADYTQVKSPENAVRLKNVGNRFHEMLSAVEASLSQEPKKKKGMFGLGFGPFEE